MASCLCSFMVELRLFGLLFFPSLTFPFHLTWNSTPLLSYLVDEGKRWMLLGASRQELAWLQLIGVTEARIRQEISVCAQLLIELSFFSGCMGLAQVGQVKLWYNHYFTPERTCISILLKFDTDYKDVYLQIGDCMKIPSWRFWGWSKSASLENELSELEISRSQNHRKVHPSRLV
jgi:hypothetical protein